MKITHPLILVLLGLPLACAQVTSDFTHSEVIQRIAFGSCFDPAKGKAGIFEGILKQKPDVFVFLGDNMYGDTGDMMVLRRKYAELEAVEGFRKLRDSTRLLATWDDHDYGINDGGKSYLPRDESQRIFLDFFKEPTDSPRRGRAGIYASYSFGPQGRTCQILVLDTRYFRDELPRTKSQPRKGTVGWYEPTGDTTKTLLGEAQWQWLDRQLAVPADVRILASSIQVLAADKGMENWGNVPHERKRLFALLRRHRAQHTFAISGDVHFAELSQMDVDGYPFLDLTSSGLSHTSRNWALADNPFRVGRSHWEMNAGLIEIDWQAGAIELAAINPEGEKILRHTVRLSELTFQP